MAQIERWRTEKADYREAFTHSAGPIVANGIVVSGINGCELFTQDGCFITGHDPAAHHTAVRAGGFGISGFDQDPDQPGSTLTVGHARGLASGGD